VEAPEALSIVPANESTFEDLQAIFGARGPAHRCQCQRYKLAPGESFTAVPVEVRAERLRQQTACGDRGAATTSGLVASLAGAPSAGAPWSPAPPTAGWCAS
jgi:hypothetical protein